MIENIFLISLSMSAVILILLVLGPVLNKVYYAKFRYIVWILIALRLVIPLRVEFDKAPVTIPPVPEMSVVIVSPEVPETAVPTNPPADDGFVAPYLPEVSNPPTQVVLTVREMILYAWGLGAILFVSYHIITYYVFKRRIKPHLARVSDYEKLPVYVCSAIASPMMTGFLKPMILLPETEYSENELEVVLKHEYMHYKRGDLWIKLLFVIANAMHFFNPFVYMMIKAANRDMEYSCDDLVLKDKGIDSRKEYSMTILKSMQKNNKK